MKVFNFFLSLIALLFAGCSSTSPSYQAARVYDFPKDRIIPLSYDSTWSRTIRWFNFFGTPVKSSDKDSGKISLETRAEGGYAGSCDCGTTTGGRSSWDGKGERWDIDVPICEIHVSMNRINGDTTAVTINTSFKTTLNKSGYGFSMAGPPGAPPMLSGSKLSDSLIVCNSTGRLEAAIFKYLERK